MLLINFQQMLINSNNRNGIKLLAEVLVKIQFLYNTLDDVEMDKSLLMRSVSDPSNTFDFLSQLFRLAEQQWTYKETMEFGNKNFYGFLVLLNKALELVSEIKTKNQQNPLDQEVS